MRGETLTKPRSMATPRVSRPSACVFAPRPTAIRTMRGLDAGGLALLLDLDRHPVPADAHRLDLDARADVDLPLGEAPREELRDLLVLDRQEPRERLDDRDLDPVGGEDVRELDAHRAGPDHHHGGRQALEPERLVGADDPGLVDRHARQALRRRARREHDRPGLERPGAPVRRPGRARRPAPSTVPRPGTRVILFFRNRNSTPFDIRSATWRLRGRRPGSRRGGCRRSRRTPPARWKSWSTSAFRRSAFVGMQPQFRQMPPGRSASTTATRWPSWAARIAET